MENNMESAIAFAAYLIFVGLALIAVAMASSRGSSGEQKRRENIAQALGDMIHFEAGVVTSKATLDRAATRLSKAIAACGDLKERTLCLLLIARVQELAELPVRHPDSHDGQSEQSRVLAATRRYVQLLRSLGCDNTTDPLAALRPQPND
jgi:hypothetical protein